MTAFNLDNHLLPRSHRLPRALLELAKAQRLQQHWLPNLADLPTGALTGLEIAISFRPDDWVSGDLVHAVPLPNGETFVCIADVCGKGFSAGMIAAGVNSALRCLLRTQLELVSIIELVNEDLVHALPPGSFVTLLAAIIDNSSGAIRYVNAGHHPASVLSTSGAVRHLGIESEGPLGIEAMSFELHHGHLSPGELLVFFTDGCVDSADESGHRRGTAGLLSLIQAQHRSEKTGGSLQELADEVLRLIVECEGWDESGAVLHDDSTFLLLRRGAAEAVIDTGHHARSCAAGGDVLLTATPLTA